MLDSCIFTGDIVPLRWLLWRSITTCIVVTLGLSPIEVLSCLRGWIIDIVVDTVITWFCRFSLFHFFDHFPFLIVIICWIYGLKMVGMAPHENRKVLGESGVALRFKSQLLTSINISWWKYHMAICTVTTILECWF